MHIPTKEEFLEAIHNASKEQLEALIVHWIEIQEIGAFAMSDAATILEKEGE